MPDDNDRLLSTLDFWPAGAVSQLKDAAIDSAQQVVSIAATDSGTAALAEQAKLAPEDIARLIDRTRAAIVPSRIGGKIDTQDYGLGALGPGGKE